VQWVEISVVVATEVVEATTVLFEQYGMPAIAIESRDLWGDDWIGQFGELYIDPPLDLEHNKSRLTGYLPAETFDESVARSLERSIEHLTEFGLSPGPVEALTILIDEQAWESAWKKYYHAQRISPRVAVCPVWEEYTPVADERVILMDPGMAFGTGTHPTTVLCLTMLDTLIQGGERLIDVGCGSAILSVAAAKLGAREVLAIDLDPLAVRIAKENTMLNKVECTVTVECLDLLQGSQGLRSDLELWDGIVANILAEVVVRLIPEVLSVLRPGGWLVLSGIIVEKRGMVEQALSEHLFRVVDVEEREGWCAIAAVFCSTGGND